MMARLILDGLLLTTTLGTALVVGALALVRFCSGWSGHLRHSVVLAAVMAQLVVLGLHTAARPEPLRCVIHSCLTRTPNASTEPGSFYTWSAAGKFADLKPDSAATSLPASSMSIDEIILLIWLIGTVGVALRSATRRLAAHRIVREAAPVTAPLMLERLGSLAHQLGVRRAVRLATHPAIAVPSVSGIRRPTILVPVGFEQTPIANGDIILVHELAHVRRRDMLASLLADISVALFWFNPVVRHAAKRMGVLQELAADSTVLQNGVRASTYAQFLLDTFRAAADQPARMSPGHALIGECQIETRVKAILDQRSLHGVPPRPLSLSVFVMFALMAIAVTLAPSALHAFTGPYAQVAIERRLLNASSLDSIIRPLVINRMAERYVAGAAVAVMHEGRVVYQQGFGRREVFQELPVEADRTIWRIGSITKVLTGVAILQLVDRGLLRLDADVNTYLTEFKVPSTFREPVRVRHLLTHTAGFDQIGLNRHVTRAEDVRPLGDFLKANLIRIRPPDEVTTYDTYAITLAGYLVEQVSGLSYEEYLRRNIFEPMGMHRSSITIPPALTEDVAVGYGFAGSWEAERWEYMNTDPASTVNSTVADMSRFALMLLEGGRYNGRQVLSPHSARAMLTRQFTNHPDQPGYGFTLFEDPTFGVPGFSHGGSMTGFGSFLFLVPEHRLGIYIATNQESGAIAHPLLTMLVDTLFPGHGPATPMRPRTAERIDLTKFVGRYANSMYHHTDPSRGWTPRPFELRADSAGRLVFDGKPAFAVGPLSFQREDGVLLSFRQDTRGQITHFFVNQSVFERLR